MSAPYAARVEVVGVLYGRCNACDGSGQEEAGYVDQESGDWVCEAVLGACPDCNGSGQSEDPEYAYFDADGNEMLEEEAWYGY